ncbi:DUF72 domain-containing protein [Actinocatenispora sera]|uniref:DUF72 domain-containing protein n=1 Tax=Actinocatenispora sera TaxID=390989 RepID=UPI000A4A994C|nr:DUF72 domain-containing protein [Actinocatenispora sera]
MSGRGAARIVLGTSGWQYRDWRGVLYPAGVPQRRWLEHYAARFDTVELNNAFYRLPSRETFAAWRQRTPDGFVLTVKASRYLTHVRRLREPAEPVARLLSHAAGLGDRLCPILLQLPPTLTAEPERLAATLAAFPAGQRVAVEPRHESWWTPSTRDLLERHGAALCWADRFGPVTPTWRTADFGYLRLHEGGTEPWPHYPSDALRRWLDRIGETFAGTETYVYLNNDPHGFAVTDAVELAELARTAGLSVTRTPTDLPVAGTG